MEVERGREYRVQSTVNIVNMLRNPELIDLINLYSVLSFPFNLKKGRLNAALSILSLKRSRAYEVLAG